MLDLTQIPTFLPDHENPTRDSKYLGKAVVIPHDMDEFEYSEMPILGRELLHLLTSGIKWKYMEDGMEARRLLRLSTRYEMETALYQYGHTTWEEVGNSLLQGFLSRGEVEQWSVPEVHENKQPSLITDMQYALARVQSRYIEWTIKPVLGKTIFGDRVSKNGNGDYAHSITAATYHTPYYGAVSPLFKLPAEIRSRIFQLCIPDTSKPIVLYPPRSQTAASILTAGMRYAQEPGVLLTNKQIRSETWAMYYHNREILIPVMPLVGPKVTVYNALCHVVGVLPLTNKCTIFGHFAWTDEENHFPYSTAIAYVELTARTYRTKIIVEGSNSIVNSNPNCLLNGLENLVEAVLIASPFHLTRIGVVEFVLSDSNPQAYAVFNQVRCYEAPWVKRTWDEDQHSYLVNIWCRSG